MSKSKKPVNDPLEAAKISQDAPKKSGWGKGKKRDDKADADTMPTTEREDVAVAPKPERPVVAKPSAPKAPPAGVFKYRVTKACTFSTNGQITKLGAGVIISSQHYGGPPGIEKLKSCGVPLELVEG